MCFRCFACELQHYRVYTQWWVSICLCVCVCEHACIKSAKLANGVAQSKPESLHLFINFNSMCQSQGKLLLLLPLLCKKSSLGGQGHAPAHFAPLHFAQNTKVHGKVEAQKIKVACTSSSCASAFAEIQGSAVFQALKVQRHARLRSSPQHFAHNTSEFYKI